MHVICQHAGGINIILYLSIVLQKGTCRVTVSHILVLILFIALHCSIFIFLFFTIFIFSFSIVLSCIICFISSWEIKSHDFMLHIYIIYRIMYYYYIYLY